MGSTDNFLPGTVSSVVASAAAAAATVPATELVEVAELEAAEALTEDVPYKSEKLSTGK